MGHSNTQLASIGQSQAFCLLATMRDSGNKGSGRGCDEFGKITRHNGGGYMGKVEIERQKVQRFASVLLDG